jgi:hypothetical protein
MLPTLALWALSVSVRRYGTACELMVVDTELSLGAVIATFVILPFVTVIVVCTTPYGSCTAGPVNVPETADAGCDCWAGRDLDPGFERVRRAPEYNPDGFTTEPTPDAEAVPVRLLTAKRDFRAAVRAADREWETFRPVARRVLAPRGWDRVVDCGAAAGAGIFARAVCSDWTYA